MKKTIVIIFGGSSTEREISLITGVAVAKGVFKAGFESFLIDTISPDNTIEITDENYGIIKPKDFSKNKVENDSKKLNISTLIESINKINPFKVFIGLHGSEGENGHIQSLLDLNNIKYCGSGTKASAIGMDKNLSKILAKDLNIPIANWIVVSDLINSKNIDKSKISKEEFSFLLKNEIIKNYGFPVVIKANSQGSSVGVKILQSENDLHDTLKMIDDLDDDFMIEKYIKGREFSIPIIKGEVFPIIEIIPNEGFYDYEHKYSEGKTEHICPAVLSNEQEIEMGKFALKIFNRVGCEEYGRVDFILNEKDGKFYFLELNTLPGFTELSLVPESALVKGYKFHELLKYLLD